MSKISDYGGLNSDGLLEFGNIKPAIESMLGILLFPIVKEEAVDSGFKLIGYEKTFWSTKEKGYVKIEYLQKYDVDISDLIYDDQTKIQHYDMLLGFEFYSEYSSYSSIPKLAPSGHTMGRPRKEVLSFLILEKTLKDQIKAWRDLRNGGIHDPSFYLITNQIDRRQSIINLLNKFNRYKITFNP